MSNAGAAFIAGLLGGGVKGYQLGREWGKEDEIKKALLDAVKDPGANDGSGQAQPLPERQRILAEFSPSQAIANSTDAIATGDRPQPDLMTPQVPTPSEQMPRLIQQQAAQAPMPPGDASEQAATYPVAQSKLYGPTPPTVSSMLTQPNAGMTGGSAGAPAMAEQVAQPAAASIGDASANVSGKGVSQVIADAASRGRQEDDQLKKFAYAAALKGDLHSALQITQEAQSRRYARDDLKYAVGVAGDPAGDEAQKMIKMIGRTGLPGVDLVTDQDTGIATLKLQQADGESKDIVLKGNALMRTAVAYRKAMRGDPSALADLAAVDKDYAAQAAAAWQFNQHLAAANNSAANIKSNIVYRDQRAEIEDRRYNRQERRLDEQQRKDDEKQAQDAQRRAAAAALVQEPASATLRAKYVAAGGSLSDLQHLNENRGGDKYQVQVDAVRKALSNPQLDAQGKPVMNLMTGTPNMVPDLAREKRFVGFMNAAGIKDTNEGLLKFQQAEDVLKGVQTKYIEALAANPNAKLPSGKTVAQALDEQYKTPGLSALALAMRQEQSSTRR